LKITIIFLPLSSNNSKFPIIIIFEIIFFIIELVLNFNILKDEIKNCLNISNADIKINLIWISTKSKKFEVKINQSEKFHDVIIKFMKKNHKLFKFNIIKELYISNAKSKQQKKPDENSSLKGHSNNNISDENNITNEISNINNENDNITNDNNNINNENNKGIDEKNKRKIIDFSPLDTIREPLKNGINKPPNKASKNDIKIIENEDKYEYKTFKELKLDDNIDIFFETRDTRDENEEEKVENEKQKFEKNGPKIDNKRYFIFKFENEEYPLFIDKNLKLEDALLLFQKEYYSFIDYKIKSIEYYEKEIAQEKDKSIKQLRLKEGSVLKLNKKDDKEISDINIIKFE
jgi:hypothetical protein